MSKTAGNSLSGTIFIDSDEFQNIKWLRIKLFRQEYEILNFEHVD